VHYNENGGSIDFGITLHSIAWRWSVGHLNYVSPFYDRNGWYTNLLCLDGSMKAESWMR
jgi:hypothetical protein